jgi:flavin-dependent dehydrogenase
MFEKRCDVLIVGAGPAGASLAWRLGRAGFHVRVLEARRFPRFKACGEFLNPECVRILRELGVESELRALGARRLSGFHFFGFGREAHGGFVSVGSVRPTAAHGLALRREVLDAVVLSAAQQQPGVEHHEGFRATAVLRDSCGGVRGVRARGPDGEHFEIEARFTIGADGVRSAIAGALGVRSSIPWLQKLALVTHYAHVRDNDRADLHFFPGGYFASHTVDRDQFSVNLVVDVSAVRRSALGPAEYFERAVDGCPRLRARLAGAQRIEPVRGVGPLACTTSRQVFDGAALVGDAAGYVDPMTGEGVYTALRGAELLAESLESALHAGRTDAASLRTYAIRRRRELAPRAFIARLLQRGLRHDWIATGVLASMQTHPRFADLLVSVSGDYVPLSELARPAVWRAALRRDATPVLRTGGEVGE